MDDLGPRERMIRSAAVLLGSRGYEGTALSEVIALSQAPKGSTYHHFPGGKDELVDAALRFVEDGVDPTVDGLVTTDPASVVEGFVAYWRDMLVSEGGFERGCPLVGVTVSGVGPAVRELASTVFTHWVDGLARSLTASGVEETRATGFATLLLSACEGAVVLARAARSTAPLDAVEVQLRDAALRLRD